MIDRQTSFDSVSDTLAPPGTGLPRIELWLARRLVGWKSRRTSRRDAEKLFADERVRIRRAVEPVADARAARRVLIPRPRGLEDSSRYWSIYMTLDHLRIVNDQIAGVIDALARGALPGDAIRTADVKPSPAVDRTVVTSFEHACDAFERRVAELPELRTKLTWPHPWFGPFNSARWHFMAAFHMALHRKQIDTILAARAS